MARNSVKRNGRSESKPRFDDFWFVDLFVTKSDEAVFKDWWGKEMPNTFDELATLAEQGHKISATYDEHGHCFIVSFTCLDEGNDNYCGIISSRSDDLLEAIGLNLFKVREILKNGQWPAKGQRNNWG